MSDQYMMPQMAAPSSGGITIRMPKIDWQMAVLLVIAAITALQTVQLANLRGRVSAAPAVTSSNASSSAPAGGSSKGGLQGMVGGC